MRKISKKILGIMLTLIVLFTSLPVQAVYAGVDVPTNTTVTAYPEKDITIRGTKKNEQYLCYVPTKATSLKTSNKTIVTLKQANSAIYLVPKKAGTATVSFKCSGKTYKTKVTVRKYVNPITSVKIGSTTITGSKFNASSNLTLSYANFSNKKVKTTVKLAKGWKLVYRLEYLQKGWMKSTSVKNGGTIPVKGGKGFTIIIMATNTKTGQHEDIFLMLK